MKCILLAALLSATNICMAMTKSVTPKDSLLQVLAHEKNAHQTMSIYRNLADLSFETPDERTYLKLTYQEAIKEKDYGTALEALGELGHAYIKAEMNDSVEYYKNIIQEIGPNDKETESWITYLNMRLFYKSFVYGDNKEAVEKELAKRESADKTHSSIYQKIEDAYILGTALYSDEKPDKAFPYFLTATKLAKELPFKEGFKLQILVMRPLGILYMAKDQNEEGLRIMEDIIKLQTNYYHQFQKAKRPFYYINEFYIPSYTALLISPCCIEPEKSHYYMEKILALCKQSPSDSNKYSCFLAMNNYYINLKEYEKAITANDSLIKYAYKVVPRNVPGIYDVSSQIYEEMGRYKDAFITYRTSRAMQDSITSSETQEQINKLQVKYNVDKLKYEKTQLEIKNKHTMLICLWTILAIVTLVCLYLYKNLQKERRMKSKLHTLKAKAEESEKMKTAFINSICHEIRTPLNSIVGFTDILFDGNIDQDIRDTFPEEIQKNAGLLTSLIDSMIEVSKLDVSEEKLPLTDTNINSICHREMDILRASAKSTICYHLDIPQEETVIPCHERYLSLVIENLLNNANKFTENGDITLHFHINEEADRLEIHVKDTGCGIPKEKSEEVFERFTKLDTYKPGNGLGLYLCKLIVKRLSGKISMDETVKRGTTIVISLPLQAGSSDNLR